MIDAVQISSQQVLGTVEESRPLAMSAAGNPSAQCSPGFEDLRSSHRCAVGRAQGRASPRLGGRQRQPSEASRFGDGEAEQPEARLGELVDRALLEPIGMPLMQAQQPDETARHGAESDLGVSHAELPRGLPGRDVPHCAGARPPGASRRSRPAPVMNRATSGWVQLRRADNRSDMENTSAGSVMPADARSIMWPQRSRTSLDAVSNS